jgi:hypothetical protein
MLGVDPITVESQLGSAQDRSLKLRPLVLKYGPLELSFWGHLREKLQLMQICLDFKRGFRALPEAVQLTDWIESGPVSFEMFSRFLMQSDISLEEIDTREHERSVVLPSGVKALFVDNQLRTLVLSKKEREEKRAPLLDDEREPSIGYINQQLEEARESLRQGFVSASMLLAWGALEAALRRSALHAGYAGKVRGQPSALIQTLLSLGVITSEQAAWLESVRRQRTMIAHGLKSEPFPAEGVSRMIFLAESLLKRELR